LQIQVYVVKLMIMSNVPIFCMLMNKQIMPDHDSKIVM